MYNKKVVSYNSELEDEFSTAKITPRIIDGSYDYMMDKPWQRAVRKYICRPLALPMARLYPRLRFGFRIVGRERLAEYGDSAYFIYGNHTQAIADAFIPSILSPQKETLVIVHPSNVSMPVLGRITPYLGALPLPDDKAAYLNFITAIQRGIAEKKVIAIYPERHIWPYYTGIRSFSDESFYYPVKYGVPAFCFTNTYRKRRLGGTPRIITYIDGPFFPDSSIPYRKRRAELRNRIFCAMQERASLSDVERIKYVKREEEND